MSGWDWTLVISLIMSAALIAFVLGFMVGSWWESKLEEMDEE